MTASDAALLTFTACNTLRVLAYLPQILRILRDREGATAISYTTWGLFTVSNLSTVAYALATVQDMAMALVFGFNTLSCLAILGLTAWKRHHLGAGAVLNATLVGAAAKRS
ncbi:MAG TPA: hypothetical protein VIL65_16925 [Beijerinckiaceae bacterium]|jgi:uncharacterized protein with PQ loop repeat